MNTPIHENNISTNELLKNASLKEKEAFYKLEQIIRLQQKAYKLLKWLDGAMINGFISPKSAHAHMNMNKTTEAWLIKHILNLPEQSRPNINNKDELEIFCSLFSTFLDTSFDLVENPKHKINKEDAQCFCRLCCYLMNISHLHPKKLGQADKKRAIKMKYNALMQLCIDNNLDVTESTIEKVLESQVLKEDLAMIAYAEQLLLRSKGISNGPAVLSLWRDFAWEKPGHPKKDYQFNANLVLNAKYRIINKLK